MKNLLSYIERQIECPICLKCGSFFVRKSYFCKICEIDFVQNFTEHRLQNYDSDLAVNSFLCWKKFESDSCSELVYLLKTRSSQSAWRWYVNLFENEICRQIKPESNTFLIAIPGSKKSFHTNYLSKEIERLTGCKSLFILRKKPSIKEQKRKNANERVFVDFEISEEFTENLLLAEHVYLIDDIVTTGATLISVRKTLQEFLSSRGNTTANISALTLFYRIKIN